MDKRFWGYHSYYLENAQNIKNHARVCKLMSTTVIYYIKLYVYHLFQMLLNLLEVLLVRKSILGLGNYICLENDWCITPTVASNKVGGHFCSRWIDSENTEETGLLSSTNASWPMKTMMPVPLTSLTHNEVSLV